MDTKMETKVLISVIIAGVFGSLGFVAKEWTSWTSHTLVDLDKRTAIMETKIIHTNEMVAQNYHMLKQMLQNYEHIKHTSIKTE